MRSTVKMLTAIVGAVLLGWALLHVAIVPVNPEQPPPEEHFSAPCWTCHVVSGSVDIRELRDARPGRKS